MLLLQADSELAAKQRKQKKISKKIFKIFREISFARTRVGGEWAT
jgi:hypothetical protein